MPAISSILLGVGTAAAVAGTASSVASSAKNAEMQEQALDSQKDISAAQVRIAQRQEDRADEMYNLWKEQYGPLEEQLLSEYAKGPGLAWMDQAQADTKTLNEQYNQASKSLPLTLAASGIKPGVDSGRYKMAQTELTGMKAGDIARAINEAKQQGKLQWQQGAQSLVGLGRGLGSTGVQGLAQAANSYGQAAQTGQGILGTYQQQQQNNLASAQGYGAGLAKLANMDWGQWGGSGGSGSTTVYPQTDYNNVLSGDYYLEY